MSKKRGPNRRHDRQYGETRTDTIDPRTTLHRLSRSPGAFRNSPLRGDLPEPLVTTLDTYARQDLKGCLQALADVTERYGFDLAIQALENAVQHHQIAYPDILVRAARMAEWPYPEAQTVDLRTYNVLIPSREMEVSP